MHGWPGYCQVFKPMFPVLDRSNFTYAFVDYHGFGRSKHLAGRHTMQEVPVHLETVIEAFHAKHSMRYRRAGRTDAIATPDRNGV